MKKIGKLEKKWREPPYGIQAIPNCEGCTVEVCTIPDIGDTRKRCWEAMKDAGWTGRER